MQDKTDQSAHVGAHWKTAPVKGPKLANIEKNIKTEAFSALNDPYENAFRKVFTNYDEFSSTEENRPLLKTAAANPRQLLVTHFAHLESTRDERVTGYLTQMRGPQPADKNSDEFQTWNEEKDKLKEADKNIQTAQQQAAGEYLKSLWIQNTQQLTALQKASYTKSAQSSEYVLGWILMSLKGSPKDNADLNLSTMSYDDALNKVKEFAGDSPFLSKRKLRPNAKENDTAPNPDIDCVSSLDSTFEASTALLQKVAKDCEGSEVLIVPGTEDGIANVFAASMLTALNGDYIGAKMDPEFANSQVTDPRIRRPTGDSRTPAVKAIHQDFNDMMHSEAAATGELGDAQTLMENFMMHEIQERGYDAVKQAFAPKSYGPSYGPYALRNTFKMWIQFTPSCQEKVSNKDFAKRMLKAGMNNDRVKKVMEYGLQSKSAGEKREEKPVPPEAQKVKDIDKAIKSGKEEGLTAQVSGENSTVQHAAAPS